MPAPKRPNAKRNQRARRTLRLRVIAPPQNMCELLLAVRRVRNNLFHGDKANPGLSRNVQLFEAAIAILDALLEAHAEVRAEYQINQEMA